MKQETQTRKQDTKNFIFKVTGIKNFLNVTEIKILKLHVKRTCSHTGISCLKKPMFQERDRSNIKVLKKTDHTTI